MDHKGKVRNIVDWGVLHIVRLVKTFLLRLVHSEQVEYTLCWQSGSIIINDLKAHYELGYRLNYKDKAQAAFLKKTFHGFYFQDRVPH